MIRKRALISIVAVGLGLTAAAQPTPEDIVMGTDAGLVYFDRSNGVAGTLLRSTSPLSQYRWIAMDETNYSLVGIASGLVSRMHRISQTGRVTTLVSRVLSAQAGVLTATGEWVLVGGGANGRDLLAVQSSSYNGVTTIQQGMPLIARAITTDDDTGDLIMVDKQTQTSRVIRYDRWTRTLTTLASTFRLLTAVDHDQRSGKTYVAGEGERFIFGFDAFGMTTLAPAQGVTALKVDDLSGHVYAAVGNRVTEFDETGAVVRTFGPFAGVTTIHHLEIWARRKLSPTISTLRPGEVYVVSGSFPESPRASYVCGIGLAGLRPGLPVTGGRTINVFPDRWFFQSVAGDLPYFTADFVGTTSATGKFTARFVLPLRISVPIVVVAACANGALPGGLDITEALAVPID